MGLMPNVGSRRIDLKWTGCQLTIYITRLCLDMYMYEIHTVLHYFLFLSCGNIDINVQLSALCNCGE